MRYFALANRIGALISRRHYWQVLRIRGSFTTVAASLQGVVTTIIGSDVDHTRLRQASLYNDSTKLFLTGPLDSAAWERLNAFTVQIRPSFAILGNSLYILPIPTVSQTVYVEYASKNWSTTSGGTGQAKFAADTDLSRFDDDLMIVGLVWLIKRALGQDYVTQQQDFERMLYNLIAQEAGGRMTVDAAGPDYVIPSATVPDGTWNL